MKNFKIGDFVILIQDQLVPNSFDFIAEGRLEVYAPDGEPIAVVEGKSYDLATEGGIIHVIKKHD